MKLHEKILFGLAVGVLVLAYSCSDSINNSVDDDDDPPDPPSECEVEEQESNDYFDEANFVDVLPTFGTHTICGDMFIFPPHDIDFFFFYLNAPETTTEIPLSIGVTTDLETTPKLNLYQTIYDQFGNPTGNYMLIGQFVQDPGYLFVDSFLVPYDALESNDLFIVLEGFGPPYHLAEYEIEYWIQY